MKKNSISPAALSALVSDDIDNFIVAATPGGIEAQEARGQRDFVASTTLPIEHLYCTRADFEKMGVVYGEQTDDLFVKVTLPKGWKKSATDHSMWSKLLDEKGRERASIFYKAAFYDRKASISTNRRFNIQKDYDRKDDIVIQVKDCGNVIFSTDPVEKPDDKWWDTEVEQSKIAEVWLAERYPEWTDATAYWD